jgi:hypothetical protein
MPTKVSRPFSVATQPNIMIPGMSAATSPPKTATVRVQASRRTRTK